MERAKQLRRDQTDAERKLWSHLRAAQLGAKFRRQHPVAGYYADFCCVERRLIIELDGGQHAEQQHHDERRTSTLQAAGFRVLRFWNDDALLRTPDVLEAIVRASVPLTPTLSPGCAGGEGARSLRRGAPSPPAQPGERVGVRGRSSPFKTHPH